MSVFLSRSGVTCLVPAPRRVISWFLPLEPFHWNLWLGMIGCLAIEAFGLFVTRWADRVNILSWRESLLFGYVTSLKVFVSQGSSFLPFTMSARIVLCSCYMIDIIITSIYSGGLASILTIPALEEVADSVERLAKHKLIWMGTVSNWIIAINGTDEELMKQVLQNFRVYSSSKIKDDRKFAKSVGYVIERLQFGHIALPDYIDQDIVDSVKIMVDDIYYQYCVAFVSRSWAMLDKFNNLLLMMHSGGLIQYLEWKVVADHLNAKIQKQIEASIKPNYDDVGPVELGMENFAGIISVLIIGVVVSIFVFIGELMFHQSN